MAKLEIGAETASMLACLSSHYIGREVDQWDKKLRPSSCGGCAMMATCNKITTVIRELAH